MHFSFYDETKKLQQEFIATTDFDTLVWSFLVERGEVTSLGQHETG
jgi:hypothetical protein